MFSDVIRRESYNEWRFVCLVDGCGYSTTPGTDTRAAMIRRIHRHRHTLGLVPRPWRPRPERY